MRPLSSSLWSERAPCSFPRRGCGSFFLVGASVAKPGFSMTSRANPCVLCSDCCFAKKQAARRNDRLSYTPWCVRLGASFVGLSFPIGDMGLSQTDVLGSS